MSTEKLKKQVKNITNIYVFGNGLLSVGNGKNETTDSPTITIAKMPNHIKIGTDLMQLEITENELIVLEFKNMEGFKAFEKLVKNTKKKLKEKENFLK